MSEKCIIVAVADDGAIGVAGQLPWHIGEDLKFFKRTTMSCPVIMGRTTFESLGRALPGRLNIVLSRNKDLKIDNVVVVSSIEDAFEAAKEAPRCFVIGGSRIYEQTINIVDRMFITKVHTTITDADAFFPKYSELDWDLLSSEAHSTDEGLNFEFCEYVRRT